MAQSDRHHISLMTMALQYQPIEGKEVTEKTEEDKQW